MKDNISKRIDKIVSDRELMLNSSKEHITDSNNNLSKSMDFTIYDSLKNDSKEYNSIVKAKEIIFELTKEISCANSIEDVIKLRNKINYYINKIKKELAKRNVSQEEFEDIQRRVSDLRSNISTYLRFLKRENIINEIKTLYDNFDNLSIDECSQFKKLLSNERNYNKRILNKMNKSNNVDSIDKCNNKEINNIDSIDKCNNKEINNIDIKTVTDSDIKDDLEKNTESTINEDKIMDVLFKSSSLDIDNIDEKSVNRAILNNNTDEYFPTFNQLSCDGKLNETVLEERIMYYKNQYAQHNLFDYNNSFFMNLLNLLRNIPLYRLNNKLIRKAVSDYNMFYHGSDLGGFIGYSKKRNSIMTALSIIFKSTQLSRREIECLCSYDKCNEWISEFYENNEFKNIKLVKVK